MTSSLVQRTSDLWGSSPIPTAGRFQEQTGSQAEEGVDHRSLVALVRKPRMVVEYLPVPQQRRRSPPHVRGVFRRR